MDSARKLNETLNTRSTDLREKVMDFGFRALLKTFPRKFRNLVKNRALLGVVMANLVLPVVTSMIVRRG